jgi:hypothetical protein
VSTRRTDGQTDRWTVLPAVALLFLLACRGTLSPLSNRLKIGEEPYLVFAADGEDGKGDLFASAAGGGKTFQVTFTRLDERSPALSPDGAMLAFLRARSPDSSVSLVVFNLLNGAERRTAAPPGASALAWTNDGTGLLLKAGAGLFRTGTPPQALALERLPPADSAPADSLFRIFLGEPPVGEARTCNSGTGVCAYLASGDSTSLSAEGNSVMEWGVDSIGIMEQGSLVIRPLGGGRTRMVQWTTPPKNPREMTYFGGPRE